MKTLILRFLFLRNFLFFVPTDYLLEKLSKFVSYKFVKRSSLYSWSVLTGDMVSYRWQKMSTIISVTLQEISLYALELLIYCTCIWRKLL